MYRQRDDESEVRLPWFGAMKHLALLVAFFAILLLVDFFVPGTHQKEKVMQVFATKESDRFGGYLYTYAIQTETRKFTTDPEVLAVCREGDTLQLEVSQIFRRVKHIAAHSKQGEIAYAFSINAPVYKAKGAYPILLLLLGLIARFYTGDDVIAYVAGIMMLVMLISVLILL